MELVEHYKTRAIENLKKQVQSPKGRKKVLKQLIELVDILALSFGDGAKGLKEDKIYLRQLMVSWNQEELYHWLVLLKWVLEIRAKEIETILEDLEKYIAVFNIYQ